MKQVNLETGELIGAAKSGCAACHSTTYHRVGCSFDRGIPGIYSSPVLDNQRGRMAQATAESLKRAAAPPYPDRPCPACDAHEATITPLPTSVLPIVWPVHRPSGMVCVKWMQPEIYDALKKAGKA